MKIFDAATIRKADEITIARQNITSLELMERAAQQAFFWIKRKFPDKETLFHVYCGQGNNGGDGLAIARMLHDDNYRVVLDIVTGAGKPTLDFKTNLEKAKQIGLNENTRDFYNYDKGKRVIVDAIFGIGFSREPDEEVKSVIAKINHSDAFVIAVDVPSGMYLHKKTTEAVRADVVLTFQSPKLAFYVPDNYQYANKVAVINIGLDSDFIRNTPSNYCTVEKTTILDRFIPVPMFAHKGTLGHALLIGGSYGKIGAVCLSSKAALKSGCGLVTAYLPQCGYTVLQSAFPEAMVLTNGDKHIEEIVFDVTASAVGIGPGLGKATPTAEALGTFLENYNGPLVMDADALNLLSENKQWLEQLPANTILTPHPKELERLTGPFEDDFDRLDKMKTFSKKHNVILVGKNAKTFIVHGDAVYINTTGNAGLATGGTGDVLTGIITGLLARSYNPLDAAVLGVYLHGLAADIGVKETGTESFTASDVIKYLGKAFLDIENSILK